MGAPLTPILAREATAAKLLDMSTAEFRRLVEAGSLPGPARFDRWDVQQLQRIARGESIRDDGGLEL